MHPILDPDQLQVLLPLSPHCSSTSDPLQVSTTHPMQTRSKTGHLPRKDFGDFQCFATTLTDITEAEEPRFFKEANSKPEWQQAMVEEIEALTVQGTWILLARMSSGVNGFISSNVLQMEVLLVIRQGSLLRGLAKNLVLILGRHSALWFVIPLYVLFLVWLLPTNGLYVN
ncbi:hypothetical protein L3X38_003470 [Prunus dulcis]|uniref:Uncharacterized protein n=1 Tax=Prunus dulcis TaxID=3755 RepID=A0AAD4ZM28_PRUDU|nr:hypothetical protein L3X38_003470 [Prunus dulcis]